MCNAHRHPAGCECGFGPPYHRYVTQGEGGQDWAQDAVEEPWLVRRSLNDLNWDSKSIAEFVAEYRDLKDSELPEPTVVNRLKELLGRRTFIEEDHWRETVRVPLFRFGAPGVNGSQVVFTEGETLLRGIQWVLKIFGVGTADSTVLQVTTENTYTAGTGECKQVFVPVRLRVARVRVEQNGSVIGTGHRAQVIPPKSKDRSWIKGRGCEDLPRAKCSGWPDIVPEEVLDFDLAADSGRHPHRASTSWELDVGWDVSVKLKKIAEIGPLVRVRRIKKMSLEFTLPKGFDYSACRAIGQLWWSRP